MPNTYILTSALFALALIGAGWLLVDEIRRRADDDDEDDDVVVVEFRVPRLYSADGHAIQPCEIAAVSHLLAHRIADLGNDLHRHAMAMVVAQVTTDEADHGLDDALTRMTEKPRDAA